MIHLTVHSVQLLKLLCPLCILGWYSVYLILKGLQLSFLSGPLWLSLDCSRQIWGFQLLSVFVLHPSLLRMGRLTHMPCQTHLYCGNRHCGPLHLAALFIHPSVYIYIPSTFIHSIHLFIQFSQSWNCCHNPAIRLGQKYDTHANSKYTYTGTKGKSHK